MNKIWKIILIVLLVLLLTAALLIGIYFYRNLHWYDSTKRALKKVNAVEKQVTLPSGSVINYGEVANDTPALLLIHGQMGQWEDYGTILPELAKNWHIYAIDVYGHGQSSHEESLYYLDTNGNDLIWFIDHVIGEKTVVAGHSNGAITAAYVCAYGGINIGGVVLEDPPVFSIEGEGWENSFAYLDTYKPLHEYDQSDHSECWEAFYLRHCYWGQLYMQNAMPGIANYAQSYHDKHPDEEVKIAFLPSSIWSVFKYARDYDFAYGEHFYDLTWQHGLTQKQIFTDLNVPCVYLHAKESLADSGVYLCAASYEQAMRAVSMIGEQCTFTETETSDHCIHLVHPTEYIDAVNSLLGQ